VSGVNTGSVIGLEQTVSNANTTGNVYGINNAVSASTATVNLFGIANNVQASGGSVFSLYNVDRATSSGPNYGIWTRMYGATGTVGYGASVAFENSPSFSSQVYGFHTSIPAGIAPSGQAYGVYAGNAVTNSYGVYGTNSATGGTGVYGTSSAASTNAVVGYATAGTSNGLYGSVTSTGSNGVYGTANNTSSTGVYGAVSGTGSNGVYGTASAASSYGVYATRTSSGPTAFRGYYDATHYCDIGVASYAADCIGNIRTTGNLTLVGAAATGTAFAWTATSDERLKKDISDMDEGLDTILKLRPVDYNWLDVSRNGKGKDMGFLAQDVEKLLPTLVHESRMPDPKTGKEGMFKSLDYSRLTAPIVKAIQQLHAMLQELVEHVKDLAARIDGHDADLKALKAENADLKAENAEIRKRLDAIEKKMAAPSKP